MVAFIGAKIGVGKMSKRSRPVKRTSDFTTAGGSGTVRGQIFPMSNNIESHLVEKRVLKPSRAFTKKARVGSMAEYKRIYDEFSP